MKRFFKFLPIFVISAVLFAGCATVRSNAFLRDVQTEASYQAPPAPELVLREGDKVAILVLSQSPEMAAPFNQPTWEGGYTPGTYTVGRDGSIDFPVLGNVPVAGKTLLETERMIAGKISEKGWIREPSVKVSLENFSVTVIGQSGNAVLPVKDGSINILQAIAGTGGIKTNSNIREIMVIRTVDGVRTAYNINLQSKDLFNSPAYYLQQNDIVYVKPRGATLSTSGQSVLPFITAALSLATIISNFILWSSR